MKIEKNYENLKLENQICFLYYSTSRLIIKKYRKFLEPLNLTYPKYLVLLVLWEFDNVNIGTICSKLLLDTNTVTPLVNSMVKTGFVKKVQSKKDKRSFKVKLTNDGFLLKEKAKNIPNLVGTMCNIDSSNYFKLKKDLKEFQEKLI